MLLIHVLGLTALIVGLSCARIVAMHEPQTSAEARMWARISVADHSPSAGALRKEAASTLAVAAATRSGASASRVRIPSLGRTTWATISHLPVGRPRKDSNAHEAE